ncbi:MAG: glycosyltransferase [Candidatus Omnitrophota bacterium]|nr:glycosyltransferase [Candidatus Omnitrophota bacterium]
MSGKKVSVIIPMYNASGCIESCLSAVSRQTAGDLEVLLVDDCSTDDTVQKAQSYPFKIIKTGKRISPAKVRNYGAKNASGDILVFVDADVMLNPDSVEEIINAISAPGTDSVFGIYAEDTPQPGFFSQFQNLFIVYRYERLSSPTDITCSFFFAIKKSVFEAIGEYNEEMSYYEDIELGKRLAKGGYHCKIDPKLRVTHLKYYNHLGLIKDYLKKSAEVGLYVKREGFSGKVKDNAWPLSIKIAALSGLCLLFSISLLKITFVPFLLFFGVYNISIAPFLSYLVKARGLLFGLRSYVVLFEIYPVFLAGLSYGILKRGTHG